ncbi:MAG: LLM class flavin-dependent oxidoreductase [Deltaproteobacteria bacterium]|nr:LLM class flavin-dependent oxidoreductase [Deltaproteobacteria bacterium]
MGDPPLGDRELPESGGPSSAPGERRLRLGVVILPELPWSAARDVWRRAEELGCDHAWTYDHLAWRSLRDSAWYGAVPTLAAAATATERLRIGFLVASPNFRHPVPFARDLLALDDVSRGRIDLGIGAGGYGWDATVLGGTAPTDRERADRFTELVELLDVLLREREVSYRGRYFTAEEARSHPGCVQQPRIPFAIAATKPRGMRLAARFGQTWVTTGERSVESPLPAREGARVVRAQNERLDEICARLGRDPATLRRLVVTGPSLDGGPASVDRFHETAGRYAEAGATDLVLHWPRREPPFAADLATFERIVTSVPRRSARYS